MSMSIIRLAISLGAEPPSLVAANLMTGTTATSIPKSRQSAIPLLTAQFQRLLRRPPAVECPMGMTIITPLRNALTRPQGVFFQESNDAHDLLSYLFLRNITAQCSVPENAWSSLSHRHHRPSDS